MRVEKLKSHIGEDSYVSNTSSLKKSLYNQYSDSNENHFTLPHTQMALLAQLKEQSRWMLWITPEHSISRHWLHQMGLPEEKTMQFSQTDHINSVNMMEKALLSRNYSVVLACLPSLSSIDRRRLQKAAREGNAYGLIIYPQTKNAGIGQFLTDTLYPFAFH